MRASQLNPTAPHRHLVMVLALLASLIAAVGGLGLSTAAAAPPAPVTIVVDSVTSDIAAPDGTPAGAVPTVLVKTGGTVHVQVSFYDSAGAPAAFAKDTTVVVTSDRGGLSQLTKTALRGATSATLDVRFSEAANQVPLTVTVPGKGGTSITGTSSQAQRFDVVTQLRFVDSAPGASLQQGIGGDNACENATSTNPVCGVVILPNGAQSSQVLLSLGPCDTTYARCGSAKGSVVQTLAGLSGLYAKTNPAALLIKCDKSLCGGGQIQDQHLNFSLAGNDVLKPALPCPSKGTVGVDQDACVDYVQSKRDGSGDTLLYLLFTQDMRGSVG